VVPGRAKPAARKPTKAKHRCAKGSQAVKRRGKVSCVKPKRSGASQATGAHRRRV
jgi:hypothetical protein